MFDRLRFNFWGMGAACVYIQLHVGSGLPELICTGLALLCSPCDILSFPTYVL